MRWADPENFRWLWLVAGFFAIFIAINLYRGRTVRSFGQRDLVEQLSSSLSPGRRYWKQLLILAAVALAVLALAAPQRPGKTVRVAQKGIDIIIAVDVSLSMLAEDVPPNRLEKAKLELQDLVDKAEGDRIGVIAFAGDAHVQVPLTTDRDAVKLFIKTLSTNIATVSGTALSRAIRLSWGMFESNDPSEDKALILLTDGEDHETDPVVVARESKEKGIRIYAIGIGTPKGEAIPLRDPRQKVSFKKDLEGNVVVSRLDETTLQAVAEATDGIYYRTRKGTLEVDRIYNDIRRLAQKETDSQMVKEFDPLYPYFLVPALLLLALELALSERRREILLS